MSELHLCCMYSKWAVLLFHSPICVWNLITCDVIVFSKTRHCIFVSQNVILFHLCACRCVCACLRFTGPDGRQISRHAVYKWSRLGVRETDVTQSVIYFLINLLNCKHKSWFSSIDFFVFILTFSFGVSVLPLLDPSMTSVSMSWKICANLVLRKINKSTNELNSSLCLCVCAWIGVFVGRGCHPDAGCFTDKVEIVQTEGVPVADFPSSP